jgi:hypothetical protein
MIDKEVTNDDDDMEELLKKYYIAVPTPVAPWTGKKDKITMG